MFLGLNRVVKINRLYGVCLGEIKKVNENIYNSTINQNFRHLFLIFCICDHFLLCFLRPCMAVLTV
jgi:hypothetical protein